MSIANPAVLRTKILCDLYLECFCCYGWIDWIRIKGKDQSMFDLANSGSITISITINITSSTTIYRMFVDIFIVG